MQVTVKVPGSCGELIQGMMGEANFLVTCPINCYSVVSIKKNKLNDISVNIPGKSKIISAVKQTLSLFSLDQESGYEIVLDSDLPIGKGMASSTADMTAAIIAVAVLNGKYLTEEEIGKILLKIEPSDGIFYSGIVAFDHIHGSFYEKVGDAFDASFLIFDYGGEVDTIKFNSDPMLKKKNMEKIPVIEKAYFLVKESFNEKNIVKLGKAVTMSALENQKILFKENLEEINKLSLSFGAYGVNVAHSGTLIGILNNDSTDIKSIINSINAQFPELNCLGNFRLVNGGYEYKVRGRENE